MIKSINDRPEKQPVMTVKAEKLNSNPVRVLVETSVNVNTQTIYSQLQDKISIIVPVPVCLELNIIVKVTQSQLFKFYFFLFWTRKNKCVNCRKANLIIIVSQRGVLVAIMSNPPKT